MKSAFILTLASVVAVDAIIVLNSCDENELTAINNALDFAQDAVENAITR